MANYIKVFENYTERNIEKVLKPNLFSLQLVRFDGC